MENSRRWLGRYVLLIFLICVFNLACVVNGVKITLYDSSRIKDDLNWYKLSFKENVNMNEGQEAAAASSNAWLNEKLTSRQDMYGWKESSFSLSNGDDIWRIHFVCDLNVQNIQNWLFTPLINTHSANRVTLNLTFTIRECEQFPIKQIVKNCREKFELYYEEITVKKSTLDANAQLNEEDYFMNEADGTDETEPQDQAANRSSLYFLNKIKQLRFRDTFVSSTGDMAGLRYYNSVVDRQKHYRNSAARASGSSSSSSSSSNSGDSMINVELREIPLSGPVNSDTNSFIRFAIRDTGACISLLGVQVSFTSCPAFTKYGIGFAETPTGRDLTDLIQVTGKCPAFSTVNQPPKAICTAKGEWLITDGNLSNRCLCIPGYQFIHDKCSPCMAGYYKATTSNEDKCELCPLNSWSTEGGSSRCECVNNYYREDDSDYLSPCKAIPKLDSSHLDLTHINEDHVNMSINRASLGLSNSNIRLTIECFTCSANEYSTSRREQCDQACPTVSSANGWMVLTNKHTVRNVKVKLIIRQQLPGKELTRTILYLNLNQEVKQLDTNVHVRCELSENERKSRCLNVSINLQHELTSLFGSEQQLANRLKSNADVRIDIYALVINNDYHLIPVGNDPSAVQPARHFVKLDPIESMDTLRAILFNNSVYSLLICNSPYELDKLKFEFTFREHIYSDVDSGEQLFDELARTNNLFTNKNFNLNKLDSYTIDVKLFQLCLMNSLNDKLIKKFFGFNYNSELNNQTLMSLKNSLSERSINPNGADSNLNGSNFKTHVLLPVLLSFCFVTFFILFAVFIRRTRLNAKSSDKDYDCEKHMRKFMPALNKSCSTKCINCTNPNTSSSNSSTTSSSTSSSSRMSSTSPSTTCTTSQILERTSKLYYVDPHTYEDPALAIQEFAQEISPLDIKIESVIGGGEFGDVCKGKLKNVHNQWITVAIKTLKVGSSEKNRCDFLTEASIMAQFHHENIICLEGVVTQSNPYMIITEYMDNGSLDTFLRLNSWRLNIYDLIKMLRDIASGMKYLSEMNFVHRDLAARNILVNKELKCKVADFGLSREIEGTTTEGVYWTKGGKIPVRWTAPEAITHTKFTCSSDVWSYGVVAWEVMSYGERPYWNWSNTDVIKAVEKGFRLLIPPNCPQIIYNLMLDCWETDRLKRPRFRQIVNELDTILKSKRECLYATVKNSKQISYIDTNRPNFTQLTNIHEWLNSLNLSELIERFVSKRYLNLSQVLQLELNDLMGTFDIYDEDKQALMMESIKRIQFELNFQNGFLV